MAYAPTAARSRNAVASQEKSSRRDHQLLPDAPRVYFQIKSDHGRPREMPRDSISSAIAHRGQQRRRDNRIRVVHGVEINSRSVVPSGPQLGEPPAQDFDYAFSLRL